MTTSPTGYFITNDLKTKIDTIHKHLCPLIDDSLGGGYYDSTTPIADVVADWLVDLGTQTLVACSTCLPNTMIVS